jgi:hypothetical protein
MMPGSGLAVDRATGNGPGAAGTHVEGHVAGIERLAAERPAGLAGLDPLAADRTTGITPGAPARLRGLVPAWRLPRPLHRAASGAVRPGNPLLALAAGCDDRRMTTRSFPPPWRAEKMPGGYVVRDANDQALAYVYSRANEAEAMQAKVLTDDEARRVAVNIARLPALLRHGE